MTDNETTLKSANETLKDYIKQIGVFMDINYF